jgi:excisionase family DNA binding protein
MAQATKQQEVTDDKDRLLTPEEVCERLNVNLRWLDRAVSEKRFRVVKVGKLNRFYEGDIEAFIESQTRPAKKSA